MQDKGFAMRLKEQLERSKEISENMRNIPKNSSSISSTINSVWEGPNGTGKNGGITFSLLSRYLCCRERFRLLSIEGLKSADHFNHRLEYGNMFHLCEETYYKYQKDPTTSKNWKEAVKFALENYRNELYEKYPFSREDIDKWFMVCKIQFPIYVEYWEANTKQNNIKRVSILQEEIFSVLYKLPSGRFVRLRGKWDDVSIEETNRVREIWITDHKTKGEIDERQILRELTFNLQTLIYVVAFQEYQKYNSLYSRYPIAGVKLNVIRRPLSGGKGTIVRLKPSKKNPGGEAWSDYWERVGLYISAEPEEYFKRYRCNLSNVDINKFKRESLDPILESLCNWWDLAEDDAIDDVNYLMYGLHFRMPFGVYNPLGEGKPTEHDEYLNSGSTLGLHRTDDLFPELKV